MKRSQLEKQLRRLRGAVKSSESPIHIVKAAEKVRHASPAFIKARLALLAQYPQNDPDGRSADPLGRPRTRWLSFTTEAIIEEFGRAEKVRTRADATATGDSHADDPER